MIQWNEPWPAVDADGNGMVVNVTLIAPEQDCIGMARAAGRADTDEVLLHAFLLAHGARKAEEMVPMSEVKKWKDNHDNQVELKRIIAGRPDLAERAPLVEKLKRELDNARLRLSAIAEVAEVERARFAPAGLDGPWNAVLMLSNKQE